MIKKWILLLLKTYQYLISPLFGQCCRFHPSCSHYAVTALQTHSLTDAIFLIFKRILRCHPGTPGGLDFVPEKK